MTDPLTTTDALVELETKVAHQEATLADLSDIVARQQDQIDRLLAELRRLGEQHAELADSVYAQQSDEPPPPHY
jgi:SlyX protein